MKKIFRRPLKGLVELLRLKDFARTRNSVFWWCTHACLFLSSVLLKGLFSRSVKLGKSTLQRNIAFTVLSFSISGIVANRLAYSFNALGKLKDKLHKSKGRQFFLGYALKDDESVSKDGTFELNDVEFVSIDNIFINYCKEDKNFYLSKEGGLKVVFFLFECVNEQNEEKKKILNLKQLKENHVPYFIANKEASSFNFYKLKQQKIASG